MDDTTRKMAGQTMGAVVQQAADADVPGLLELAARIAVERGETAGKFSDATKQFFKSTALRHPDVTIPRVDDVLKEAESRDFCREGLDEIFQNIKKGCASDDGEEFGNAVWELGSYVLSEGISKKKAFKFLNTVSFNFETDAQYFDAIVLDGVGKIARKVSDKEVPEVVKLLGRIVSERGKNFDALADLEKILDKMAKKHPNVTIPSAVEILQEAKSPKSDIPQQAEDHVLDDVVQNDEQASEVLTVEDAYAMTKEQRKIAIAKAFASGDKQQVSVALRALDCSRWWTDPTSHQEAVDLLKNVPLDKGNLPDIYDVLRSYSWELDDVHANEIVQLCDRSLKECQHNDKTFEALNDCLRTVIATHPKLIPDVMEIMSSEFVMKKDDGAAIRNADLVFLNVMEKGTAEQAKHAMQMLRHNVQTAEHLDDDTQRGTCMAIAQGVAAKPKLATEGLNAIIDLQRHLKLRHDRVGERFTEALETLMENGGADEVRYSMMILWERLAAQEVKPEACEVLAAGVKRGFLPQLDEVKNSKVANALLNKLLFSYAGDEQTYARTLGMAGQACIAHADLRVADMVAGDMINCAKKLMLAGDETFAEVAVKTMEKGIEAHPELVKYAKDFGLELYKQWLKRDFEENYLPFKFLDHALSKGSVEDAKQMIATVGVDLASSRRCASSVEHGLDFLGSCLEAHPELARNVLLATQVAQTSENHDDYSLMALHDTLGKVAKADPSLAIDVVDAVKEGMQNKANNDWSTEAACKVLAKVAKDNPKVAGESADAIRACMLLVEKGSAVHIAAREGLEKIEQIQSAKRAEARIKAAKDRFSAVRGDSEPPHIQPNEGTADRAEEANKSKISPEVMKKLSDEKTQRH
jgi:hypothetical protein